MLSTCCLTSRRVSNARTMAPMLRAAPMAASPATPAPITITFAGGTLPAAVIWPVKKRPKLFAASITAQKFGFVDAEPGMRFGLADLEDDIGLAPQRLGVLHHGDARRAIGIVAELGGGAGAGFDTDLETEFPDTTRRFRGQGHTLFARVDFLRNANLHLQFSPVGPPACRAVPVWIFQAATDLRPAANASSP